MCVCGGWGGGLCERVDEKKVKRKKKSFWVWVKQLEDLWMRKTEKKKKKKRESFWIWAKQRGIKYTC